MPHQMSRRLRAKLAGLVFLGGLLTGLSSGALAGESIEQFIADYSQAHRDLGLGGEMELSFVKNIQHLLKTVDASQQRGVLTALERRLKLLDPQAGGKACQRLQLKQISFELALHQQKLAVLTPYLAMGSAAVLSEQGLAHSSLGQAWYAYSLPVLPAHSGLKNKGMT